MRPLPLQVKSVFILNKENRAVFYNQIYMLYTIVAASKIKLAAFRRFLPSLREPLLATPWILLCDFVLLNESFIDLDDICNIAPFLLQCFLGLS